MNPQYIAAYIKCIGLIGNPFKPITQAKGHVSYPIDSHAEDRLGLCSSLFAVA